MPTLKINDREVTVPPGTPLIEACRGASRKRGAAKLVWETAPDNKVAQRLYDSIGASASTWRTYELDAW